MSGRDLVPPTPQFCRGVRWDPFRDWASPSLVFSQEFASPPFSDMGDFTATRRCLGSSSWPGYTFSHFLTPSTQALLYPSFRLLKQPWAGLSEVRSSQGMWTISLDVNQFSPEEITVRMKEGYLEITGSHNERQDEHGSVTRCFTRKYNLPGSTDLEKMRSYLSGDGVLSVEIPLATSGDLPPQKTVIPVQVKVGESLAPPKKEDEEKVEKKKVEGTVEGSSSEDKNSEVTDSPTAATQASREEPGVEEPQPQIPGVISAGSTEGQQGEQLAGTGEDAAGPSDQQVPSEQLAGDQDVGGSIQRQGEQQSFGVEKDDTQQEVRGQPESPEQPGLREQGGIIQMEAAIQATEKPPAEGVEPVPSQSDAAQHPELDVLGKQDTEPAVEQFTKS